MILHTNGRGLWTEEKREVHVTKLGLGECYINVNDNENWGELRVYFDRKKWNVKKHGLIYTDEQFLRELRAYLNKLGLPGRSVDYSEQGMQGDDYVSFDVNTKFIRAWCEKHSPFVAMPA